MTIPLQKQIVYGPLVSRRLGVSLGVNVLPAGSKICNFNCPYCQYGWTPSRGAGASWPAAAEVASEVDAALARSGPVDRVTLAGNGEPTLHPELGEIAERLAHARDRHAPSARLAILSNASTLQDAAVRLALGRLDERYMKLDAGDDETLRLMNGTRVPVGEIIDALAALDGVVLQSMFTRDDRGRIGNTSQGAIDAWLRALLRVRPLAVHLYTIDREPAWAPLRRIPRTELEDIARQVEAIGISADVF